MTDADRLLGGEPVDPEEAAREAFDELVRQAVEGIPEPYASALGPVAIVVEDEPRPDQRPPGKTFYGLFEGVPRTSWAADWSVMPAKITIFRRPHEAFFPDPEARARAVESTVRHEVAHYLGIDEHGIQEIERENRTAPPR
jgi:predicted Zn-dependent protease with MMP-like domain